MTDTATETLLTTDELAKRWGIGRRALESRRARGQGPSYLLLGTGPRARVRYKLSIIEAFEKENTRCPQ